MRLHFLWLTFLFCAGATVATLAPLRSRMPGWRRSREEERSQALLNTEFDVNKGSLTLKGRLGANDAAHGFVLSFLERSVKKRSEKKILWGTNTDSQLTMSPIRIEK